MPGFEEYAALARQLSARRRDGEQGVAAEADRRRALDAAADQLGRRLTAQGQRLDQLGHAIKATPPAPAATPAAAVPVAAGGPALATPPLGGSTSAAPSGGGLDGVGDPSATPSGGSSGTAGEGDSRPGSGAGGAGGTAAAPGRPGVGAYPEGVLLPAPRPAEVDPAAELDAARQLADEADRHGRQAEALAQHPALLPTWSPLARALAVYTVCALAGSVLMLVMVVASGLELVGLGVLYASMCAGLPVASFVAGYLVLGRWGRPVIGPAAQTSRFVPMGFVICALLMPFVYCAYLLMFRVLR